MVHKLSIALSLTTALLSVLDSAAFLPVSSPFARPPPPPRRRRIRTALRRRVTLSPSAGLSTTSSFLADATVFGDGGPGAELHVDANGKQFAIGTAVAVAPDRSIKAHQVPKSAFGTFDRESRQFVPQDRSNVSRGTSCLVLPEGLRGKVARIYNTNEWDRAHPILVKFAEGDDREGGGGFNIPKAFSMHFDADELEVLGP